MNNKMAKEKKFCKCAFLILGDFSGIDFGILYYWLLPRHRGCHVTDIFSKNDKADNYAQGTLE